MRIAVIDGQGGGIGKTIVEKLRAELGANVRILALGTNALATAAMLKAGADEGASGESAIAANAPKVDIIAGCIGILAAGSMLGEITPRIAAAVGLSNAQKVLIPLGKCGIHIAGLPGRPLPQTIASAVSEIKFLAESVPRAGLNVFLSDADGRTVPLAESVESIVPDKDGVTMETPGGKKHVRAKIREISMDGNRVVLEK